MEKSLMFETILHLLRDPVWTAFAAFLGAITIFIPFLIYHLQKNTKLLTFEIISRSQLLKKPEEISSDLEIFFQKRKIESATLVTIRVRNNGRHPIEKKDYDEPFCINFSNAGDLANPKVISNVSDQINIEHRIIKDNNLIKIEVAPTLLNPEESFTVSSLVLDFNGSIRPAVRIVGGKLTETDISKPLVSTSIFILTIFFATTLGFINKVPLFQGNMEAYSFLVGMRGGIVLFGIFCYLVVLFREKPDVLTKIFRRR